MVERYCAICVQHVAVYCQFAVQQINSATDCRIAVNHQCAAIQIQCAVGHVQIAVHRQRTAVQIQCAALDGNRAVGGSVLREYSAFIKHMIAQQECVIFYGRLCLLEIAVGKDRHDRRHPYCRRGRRNLPLLCQIVEYIYVAKIGCLIDIGQLPLNRLLYGFNGLFDIFVFPTVKNLVQKALFI